MKLSEINIRDPFILKHGGKYYMYGTRVVAAKFGYTPYDWGFDVYVSSDLENFSEPKCVFEYFDGFYADDNFWAPEVHYYNDKFYMLATFKAKGGERGTAILVSDTPDGSFTLLSDGSITPHEWSALDGTLYIEDGKPYMVFCHEWTEIRNGEVCALELSPDLSRPVGEPWVLWHGGDGSWRYDLRGDGSYVTDGPWLIKHNGKLLSLWSSMCHGGKYCEAIARSDNGSLFGNWSVDERLLLENDGGHGMVFEGYDGNRYFVYHSPNKALMERPTLQKLDLDSLFE